MVSWSRDERGDGKVTIVVDDIKYAPALTQAAVGIAIGAGTDVAIQSADVTLVQEELSKVNTVQNPF